MIKPWCNPSAVFLTVKDNNLIVFIKEEKFSRHRKTRCSANMCGSVYLFCDRFSESSWNRSDEIRGLAGKIGAVEGTVPFKEVPNRGVLPAKD